ncbi:hypothetical protein UFOVP1437_38 [uncultured Caudovirales phage]|uniref:Uncharacterized protein n=1 Tax=uncultured Caudovirales phage TaxID=2100421 RepID=A0A6J5SF59_9CAUD|nr:hypothetical protein UFOVP1437_38 [uncultured Caudovirales phage]CAB5228132.1 hypothetical protein UFOVP1531_26 [uncultured Caudovirales phage]
MSRCIACNKMLNDIELSLTKRNKSPEDMCLNCLACAFEDDDVEEDND